MTDRASTAKMTAMDADAATRLGRSISLLARQLNTCSTAVGLSPAQASVLGVLVRRGPLTPSALAEIEGINPTMLSRVVGKLEAMELIHRSSDSNDQRSVRLEATPSGRRADARVKAERARLVSGCLEALEPGDAETLSAAVDSLERLADELRDQTRRT